MDKDCFFNKTEGIVVFYQLDTSPPFIIVSLLVFMKQASADRMQAHIMELMSGT